MRWADSKKLADCRVIAYIQNDVHSRYLRQGGGIPLLLTNFFLRGLINADIGECAGISLQGWQTYDSIDCFDHHCSDDFLRVRANAQKEHGDFGILYIVRQDRP